MHAVILFPSEALRHPPAKLGSFVRDSRNSYSSTSRTILASQVAVASWLLPSNRQGRSSHHIVSTLSLSVRGNFHKCLPLQHFYWTVWTDGAFPLAHLSIRRRMSLLGTCCHVFFLTGCSFYVVGTFSCYVIIVTYEKKLELVPPLQPPTAYLWSIEFGNQMRTGWMAGMNLRVPPKSLLIKHVAGGPKWKHCTIILLNIVGPTFKLPLL